MSELGIRRWCRPFGIGWSIHLWLGPVALAGVVGLLLSYLVAPPEGAEAPD